MNEQSEGLSLALANLDEAEFNRLFQAELEGGGDPVEILERCRAGMELVGKKFEDKEYFLTDLIMAAELFKSATTALEPRLQALGVTESAGMIVFGTVKGDIHDIGKDIVVAMLRGAGFTVHDLGIDVAPDKFVSKVQETGAGMVGLTGLITMSWDSMKETVQAFGRAGLRDQVKILIGGGMVNENVLNYTGADAWGRDVRAAIELARQFAPPAKEVA